MRISNNRIFQNLLYDLNRNRQRVAAFQDHLSSGVRVRRASDGAVEFTTSSLIRSNVRNDEQFQNNISSGLRKARTVQQALHDMVDLLIDLKQDAVHGANATLGAAARAALGEKAAGIKANMVSTANAKAGDVYVFGGTSTIDEPFSEGAGLGGVEDTSNATRLTVQISNDQIIDVSITGDELRNMPGGIDLFAVIDNVEQAFRNNDPDAVRAEMDHIDDAITHVTALTTEIASKIVQMEYSFEHIERRNIDQEGEVSRLVDTDFANAQSQIIKMQVAYEAAMAAHARISQTSLLNYLR